MQFSKVIQHKIWTRPMYSFIRLLCTTMTYTHTQSTLFWHSLECFIVYSDIEIYIILLLSQKKNKQSKRKKKVCKWYWFRFYSLMSPLHSWFPFFILWWNVLGFFPDQDNQCSYRQCLNTGISSTFIKCMPLVLISITF